MGIYTTCVWFGDCLARAGGSVLLEELPLVERGIEVNDKLVATLKRLSALTKA